MNFNEQSLRSIAQDLVEQDAAGIPSDAWVNADLDRMPSEQRVLILMFREGATYEREQRILREIVAMPAEEIAPRYAHRSDAEDKLAWLDRHAWILIVSVIAMVLFAFAWGRVTQAAIDFQTASQVRNDGPILSSPFAPVQPHRGTFLAELSDVRPS